jgi:ribose 5-phosphate isomerase
MNLTRLALKWRALKARSRAAGLIRPGVVVGLGSGIIVVDHTKCSPRLSTWHSVPLEVATFGWRPEALYLEPTMPGWASRSRPQSKPEPGGSAGNRPTQASHAVRSGT